MPTAKQNEFPRPLHGTLAIMVGFAIAVMGPLGWPGGIKGREGDLDAAIFFLLAGVFLSSLGVGRMVWSVRRAKRSQP